MDKKDKSENRSGTNVKFSIIIPTFNRKDLLEMCLRSLLAQNFPADEYEIIVIDDGSDDGTEALLVRYSKDNASLRHFRTDHSGPGRARNKGMEEASGKFIVFTDDDCVVGRDWLKKLEKEFSRSGADAVGGSITNPTDRYIAWAQYLLNFSSWLPKGRKRYVKDIPTANICYRREAVEGHRFPGRTIGAVYEDTLFNHALVEEGKKILFCPDIMVWHHTWEQDYGLRKFFAIQKKAGMGFLLRGYRVHGLAGRILKSAGILNLFCPRLLMVFIRSARYGFLARFILCFPLIFLGEFYKGLVIIRNKKGD